MEGDAMLDDLRGYIQVATGLTEVTTAKAREIVSSLLTQGLSLSTKAPDIIGQVQQMADELLSTGKDNREVLVGLIRTEVDRAVGRMGFVREDELAALRRLVQGLESDFRAHVSTHPDHRAASAEVPAEGTGSKEPQSQAEPKPRKKKVVVDPQELS